ncbi:MAG: hypothetical protein Q8L27_02155 [archaeon]|nr:hypothetical protein [archaeon]
MNKPNKVAAAIVSIAILALVILSGPANALDLRLSLNKLHPVIGEIITFVASVDINSNDQNLPVESLNLTLNGPTPKTCLFNVSGAKLSSCDEITNIQVISLPPSAYGHSYGYFNGQAYDYGYATGFSSGTFEYRITLNTLNYSLGSYTTSLGVKVGANLFSRAGPSFSLTNQSTKPSSYTYSDNINNKVVSKQGTIVLGAPEKFTEMTINVKEGDKYKFSDGGIVHTLGIASINLNAGTIGFFINSDYYEFSIKINGIESIDYDKDGTIDFTIAVLGVNKDSVKLMIQTTDINLMTSNKENEKLLIRSSETETNLLSKYSLGLINNSGEGLIALVFVNLLLFGLIAIVAVIKKA